MKKTEVYSWRITPATKSTLESEARRVGTSLSSLLDRITEQWIRSRRGKTEDNAEQSRLHAAVRKTLGSISGIDPKRAERAKAAIRKRLEQRYGR